MPGAACLRYDLCLEVLQLTVAVIGASNDRSKFGNKALRAYLNQGHDVFPVNPNASTIEGIETYKSILDIPHKIDRVTVYVPPEVTETVLEEVAEKGTKELFLNPGSESTAVLERARELNLTPILACSIIDIGETPNRY